MGNGLLLAHEFLNRATWFIISTCALGLLPASGNAQDAQPAAIDPREFGLQIPRGAVTPGKGRRAETLDATGKAVVAKVHVEVGDQRILMLPDGSLVARKASDAPDTQRPFVPLKADQLAEQLAAGPLSGFQTTKTRRYVYIYNTSENFALVTSRILESMFPGVVNYAKAQKIDAIELDVPLAVIMFRTEDEFQRFRRMPPGAVAYYNVLSNQVVMYEESKLARVKPELAIQQSISTIAHEGAHQILHNIGVQQRLSVWPMWLSEGLAEYFAPTSIGEKLKWKGAGQVNDLRMFELEQYLQGRSGDTAGGEMIEQTVLAARLTSAGYASAWALTHYLAKNQRAEFHKYVLELSKLGPLEGDFNVVGLGIVRENSRLFKKHFGDDLADVEKRLILHLKKQPYADPFGDWPHFAALVSAPSGKRPRRDAQLFHSPVTADRWLKEVVDKLPDEQRGSTQTAIREFPNRAAADLFARAWLQGK